MEQVLSASVANRRFQMSSVLLFALVAVVLASLGIFGVVSYTVAQRTGEMGIRLALGAQPRQLRLLVVRDGLQPVIFGLAVGTCAALAVGRMLEALLFAVAPGEPLIVSAALVLLAAIALIACYLPARRATRIDPIAALRCE
jgi:ABC-type antimicrobial peptide transport system permease subunit